MIAGPNAYEFCRFDKVEGSGFAERFATSTHIANILEIEHGETLTSPGSCSDTTNFSRR